MSRGLVIAGTMSGAGKTTVTLGLMAALIRRGLTVAPFKVGPDFIDPGHHGRITGMESRNLDGWMLSRNYNWRNFARNTTGADVAIVEGVMGLFDGFSGRNEAGSTAQMAKWLGLPVLLVVDARSMARSAAALVKGFEAFDPDVTFAGVVFNNLGSDRHMAYLSEAMEGHIRMPCLGGLKRDADVEIPERHLGLVTREDHSIDNDSLDRLVDLVEHGIDIERLVDQLPDLDMDVASLDAVPSVSAGVPKVRIGVARDRAFCFYYPENIELLEAAGAEITYFSPVEDQEPPSGLGGIYLGGGYPELHADRLSENSTMRAAIAELSRAGMPIYAECGGFMYLCREISDTDGRQFPMCGCFPMATRMGNRLKSLGYREITISSVSPIGVQGTIMRGHVFHYSELIGAADGVDTLYDVSSRLGGDPKPEGFCVRQTLGSYIHLHFGSRPEAAEAFVASCLKFTKEKQETDET